LEVVEGVIEVVIRNRILGDKQRGSRRCFFFIGKESKRGAPGKSRCGWRKVRCDSRVQALDGSSGSPMAPIYAKLLIKKEQLFSPKNNTRL
jgi:hypothetical protein